MLVIKKIQEVVFKTTTFSILKLGQMTSVLEQQATLSGSRLCTKWQRKCDWLAGKHAVVKI